MNIVEAERQVFFNMEAGNSSLLVSPSGFGKSSMLLQAFHKLRASNAAKGLTTGLGIIFAATQTPPDLVGFNFKGERSVALPDGTHKTYSVTDPTMPQWFLDIFTGNPASTFDRFVLIIEEYGQGEADVKRAIAEIFLNGGTPPHYLPNGSAVVAASNTGARYGVTKDFLFCISRRTLIEISADVDVLVDHWDKPYMHKGRQWQTMPVTKAWAKAHPDVVFEKEPEKDGPWANPRSVSAIDRYLQVVEQHTGKIDLDDVGLMEMCSGTIGMPATQSMLTHHKYRLELPSYHTVISDPVGTPTPNKADLMMMMAYELAASCKKEHIAQCLTYIGRLKAGDMAITFVTSLLRRDYKGIVNEPAMQAWIAKNAAMVSIIASLAH